MPDRHITLCTTVENLGCQPGVWHLPKLCRQGMFREEYKGPTLRARPGLGRPASRDAQGADQPVNQMA